MESGTPSLIWSISAVRSRARLVRGDQACADQVVDGVDHEQRVALRPVVDECRQLARKPMRGEPRRQIFRNRLLAQVLEGQLFALLLGSQLLLDGLQRMPARDELCRPVRTNDHQPGFAPLPRQVRDQVQRRVVAPVQVLQHEHQRRFGRERLERVAHLSQHPLARRAEHFAARTPRDPPPSRAMASAAATSARGPATHRRRAGAAGTAAGSLRGPADTPRRFRTVPGIGRWRSARRDRPPCCARTHRAASSSRCPLHRSRRQSAARPRASSRATPACATARRSRPTMPRPMAGRSDSRPGHRA